MNLGVQHADTKGTVFGEVKLLDVGKQVRVAEQATA
jgi:hypothetical protein